MSIQKIKENLNIIDEEMEKINKVPASVMEPNHYVEPKYMDTWYQKILNNFKIKWIK